MLAFSWEQIGDIIVNCPILLFTLGFSGLAGYGLSFLLFSYVKPDQATGWKHPIHLAFGVCYTAAVFLATNFKLLFMSPTPPTMADVGNRCPSAIVISLGLLFPVLIIVTAIRVRRS